jgi:hypothetical protein
MYFESINKWFEANRHSMNFDRIHFMQFTTKNTLEIYPDVIPTYSVAYDTKHSVFRKSLCAYKTRSSIERTIVSKNGIKQLHALQVLHFNHCLTTVSKRSLFN